MRARIDELDPSCLDDVANAALLALNNAHAKELSLLGAERMRELIRMAFVAASIGGAEALLLAFDQDAAYENENFRWFRSRYRQFVYVDRVVVDPRCRGRGYARSLYQHLFEKAAAAGHERVVCEINLDPPNPASDAFHAALGFEEVGRATIAGGQKAVRYFLCHLAEWESRRAL